MSQTPSQPESPTERPRRRTPLAAHGEPAVWLMGVALILCLALIIGLIGIIVYRGGRTFWVNEIQTVTLRSGETFLGQPEYDELYEPRADELARIEGLIESGVVEANAVDDDGLTARRRYRVGNRDLGQQSFRSVPVYEIESTSIEDSSLLLERKQWGVFLGVPEGVFEQVEIEMSAEEAAEPAEAPIEREVLEERSDGSVLVRQRRWESRGAEETLARFRELHDQAKRRGAEIDAINLVQAPKLQDKLTNLEWARRDARLRATETRLSSIGWLAWIGLLVGTGLGLGGMLRWSKGERRGTPDKARSGLLVLGWGVVCVLGLAVLLENPFVERAITPERLAQIEAQLDEREAELRAEQDAALDRVELLRQADSRWRLVVREPRQDRFSPISQSQPDEPMLMSSVVRAVPSNQLGFGGKVSVYLSRWWEYVSGQPRENASEGGVFPVIVGTITLTLLLTISVVPLGVVAAIYLREYARQGFLTSVIRIAVNNLAGVPSIVYGMFGLGFFCYVLGGYVDAGPTAPMPRMSWWSVIGAGVLVVTLACLMTMASARKPGKPPSLLARVSGIGAATAWLGVVVLTLVIIANTPYFTGLFRERLPEEPTFGGRGILWASLTLALMTLPVVIVATEEAISAVPGSMREGSLACGATRWQTIKRIVLPAAQPGIMTGAILAMARGAGEVAPLMLVGAVNLAPALPVSADAPYLHADRTFMHLGFHIYNLGFQNPDSEATEPLVWTTTLLLITIVLALNLAAIIIRGRLRAKSQGAAI